MDLKTGIWASRLGYGPGGWGEGGAEEKKEEKEKEKTPHMCESIGHRPLRATVMLPPQLQPNLLRQGMGTADHLTLLRLLPLFFCVSSLFCNFKLFFAVTSNAGTCHCSYYH